MISKGITGLSHSVQWLGENRRGLSSSHDAHTEGRSDARVSNEPKGLNSVGWSSGQREQTSQGSMAEV